MARDYYDVLDVPRDATSQDIKRSFRRIARECHPDVTGEDTEAEARFKRARVAYETLMDPVSRAKYDRRLNRLHEPRGSFFEAFYNRMSEADRAKPKGPRGSGPKKGDGNNLDLDDLFNDFGFGGSEKGASKPKRTGSGPSTGPYRAPGRAPGASGEPPAAGRSARAAPRRGEDVDVTVDVPRSVARKGGSVTVVYWRMQRAESWRQGSLDPGLVRIQDVADFRVVPGTGDGETFKERGLGSAGAYGGAHGDLNVRVRLVGETPARVEDDDVVRVDISLAEAILGGRISVETPQGRVQLTIPPGTNSETRMRLKKKGAVVNGVSTDLYVQLRITVPRDLDERSRSLIEEFARLNPEDPRS